MKRGNIYICYKGKRYDYISPKVQRKKTSAFSRFQPVQRCPEPTRRRFTKKEDDLLRDAVEKFGENWAAVAALVPGRTPRQCRERWKHYLSPEPPVSWDDTMDEWLLRLVGEYGSKYSQFASLMGVSDKFVKNRFAILSRRDRKLRPLHSSIPSVPRVDGKKIFTAASGRPAFTAKTESVLYSGGEMQGSRMVYPCAIGSGGIAKLPRRKDATPAEVHSGQYATIGHQTQWRDYCAQKCDMVKTDDGTAFAFLRSDVNQAYNDTANLELQSQSYNSSIAFHYGENPLAPTWICE